MRRGYRVVNPIRFFIFILVCVLTITLISVSLLDLGNADAAAVNTYRQIEIQDNDTLWNIAEQYCSNDMDIRDYICDICEINDISLDSIHSGDTIFIPVYY